MSQAFGGSHIRHFQIIWTLLEGQRDNLNNVYFFTNFIYDF